MSRFISFIGSVVEISDAVRGVTANGTAWEKRVLVINHETFGRCLAIDVFNTDLSAFSVNDVVRVDVTIDSRRNDSTGRWYTTARGYNVQHYSVMPEL